MSSSSSSAPRLLAHAVSAGVRWGLDVFGETPSSAWPLLDDLRGAAWLRVAQWWRATHGDAPMPGPEARLPYPLWREAARMARRGVVGHWQKQRGQWGGDQTAFGFWSQQSEALQDPALQFEEEEEPSLDPAIVSELLARFYALRQKKGERGLRAAARDVAIVALVVAGYSNAAIAVTLDIPQHSVTEYRRRIRQSLEQLAEQAGVDC